jgi:hypothetical protein
MPKFRILAADDNTSRPKGGVFRRATTSGSASSGALYGTRARERGVGPLLRFPLLPKRSISLECRSSIEADVTSRVGEVCWVSLIGKATDCFGELEGSTPFTQLQTVAPLATHNPCGRSPAARPFVPGCTYEAALAQIVKEELPDPHSEGLRMQ